jgi:hypothetical protein
MRPLYIIALVVGVHLAACAKKDDPGFQGWVEADLIFVGPDEAGRLEWLTDAFTRTSPRQGDMWQTRVVTYRTIRALGALISGDSDVEAKSKKKAT